MSVSPAPPDSIELRSSSPEETMSIATALAGALRPGDVVALHGALGAGKTCFVRGLASGLGVDPDAVSSPTFILLHEYAAPDGRQLAHLDGYRLGGEEELETIGFAELLAEGEAVVAVEWAERFGDALPRDRVDVTLSHDEDDGRRLVIAVPAALADRLAALRPRQGTCPQCSSAVGADDRWFPFCSKRCRYADLHGWLTGRYTIQDRTGGV